MRENVSISVFIFPSPSRNKVKGEIKSKECLTVERGVKRIWDEEGVKKDKKGRVKKNKGESLLSLATATTVSLWKVLHTGVTTKILFKS